MDDAPPPRLVGIGGIFIDDIVLPTGQTYMAQLGGGVVHALMGAALWDERPGIVTLTGSDFPAELDVRLQKHLDTRGLHRLNIQQARAWQLFEEDGTRRELYRTTDYQVFIAGAQPEHLPQAYQQSAAFYLLQGFEGIHHWRPVIHGLVLWEPLQQIMLPGSRESLRAALSSQDIDIVSPNLIEAQAVYGDLPAEALLTALLDDGAKIAALRMGPQGSLLGDKTTGARCYMPAVPVPQIIDQTGAGNTYCGALLLGLLRGHNLQTAAAMAAAAASFCLEQTGVLDPETVNRKERDQRFMAALTRR